MNCPLLIGENSKEIKRDPVEEWRAVAACSKYMVSNKGNIIGPSGKALKPLDMQVGYHSVCLSLGNRKTLRRYVHVLVAEAFLGEVPKDFVVNHIDGNKKNNELFNLEIISRKENGAHWVRTGGRTGLTSSGVKSFCDKCGQALYRYACGSSRCKACEKEKNIRKRLQVLLLPPTNTEWRQTPVDGYLVSKDGCVWSIKGEKILKPGINKPGYEYVNIGGRNHSISRLVVEAFVGLVGKSDVVDHIDHNKRNNHLENLRIISRSANTKSFQAARRSEGGLVNTLQRLTEDDAREIIRIRHEEGLGAAGIAKRLGVPRSTVSNVIYGVNFGYLNRPWGEPDSERFSVKLNDDKAKEIIAFYANGETQASLAKRFEVSASSVRDILIGKTYKHLSRPS